MDKLTVAREHMIAGREHEARRLVVEALKKDRNDIDAWQLAVALSLSDVDRQQALVGLQRAVEAQSTSLGDGRPSVASKVPVQEASARPVGQSRSHPMNDSMHVARSQEVTLYKAANVNVTTSRLVIGSTTYSMRNIASVGIEELPPDRKPGSIIALVGTVFFLAGMAGTGWAFIIGIVLLAMGVVVYHSAKSKYAVRLSSTSGEASVLVSDEKKYVEKIVHSIEEAIVDSSP